MIEGATGKFLLQQMAAVAELEAGMISALKDLDEDRALARELGHPAAAISATGLKAKLPASSRKEVGKPGERPDT
jgi:hypothetical protein